MQALPGNRHFQGTVEFATLINFYFGTYGHITGQLLLYGAIQSQAMANIVVSTQTFDNLLVDIFHKTCGITLAGNGLDFGWKCFSNNNSTMFAVDQSAGGSPFGQQPVLFSMGLLIVILACLPLAMSNLDDNIGVQIVAFFLTLLVVTQWFLESSFSLDASRVPPDKKVNAQQTVWMTMLLAVVIYGIIGLFPALGFDGLKVVGLQGSSVNVINIFTNPEYAHHLVLNKIFCYMFTIVMLLPAIPMSFIVSENNLVQNFALPHRWQKFSVKFVCFLLPWILCIPMQTGSLLGNFMNWTGVLFVSPANFIIPFCIFLKCLHFRREYNEHRALTPHQTEILKQVHVNSSTIVNYLEGGRHSTRTKPTLFARTLQRFTKSNPITSTEQRESPASFPPSTIDPTQPSDTNEIPTVHVSVQRGLRGHKIVEWSDDPQQPSEPASPGFSPTAFLIPSANPSVRSYHSQVVSRAGSPVRDGLQISPTVSRGRSPPGFDASGTLAPRPTLDRQEVDEFWLDETVPDPESERRRMKLQQRDLSPFRAFGKGGGGGGGGGDAGGEIPMISLTTGTIKKVSLQVEGESIQHSAAPTYSTFQSDDIQRSQNTLTEDVGENEFLDIRDLKGSALRKSTLPHHPHFVSPTFMAVPVWIPISGRTLAVGLLSVTTFLSLGVIALEIVSAVS
ncbi:hypothetical protein HDU98_008197 [Podochytrium sp. JEL0797]|nr:hypothetical protein HDU98_008197 [Podochytrium sp. JEL0797]